jgi:hypothetical protein
MRTNKPSPEVSGTNDIPKALTVHDLTYLGLGEIAYIRPVTDGEKDGFGVFAANGEPLAMYANFDVAKAAAIQHDLAPQNIH